MDTFTAIRNTERAKAKGSKGRTFDWDKAARLIKDSQVTTADAGLRSDLEWTQGTIFANGVPVDDGGAFLASLWATPVLLLPDEHGELEEVECFVECSDDLPMRSDCSWPVGITKKHFG